MDFHEIANAFPMMPEAELQALADDIAANGLHEMIVEFEGKILDGRNRFVACGRANVEPVFKPYRGDDPLSFVVSKNLHRRHLDTSQRSMAAAKLATMKQGARTDLSPIGERSQEQTAELLNVGKRSVERAREVLDDGAPELIEAVEQGEISVSAAAKIATSYSKEEQRTIVAATTKSEKKSNKKPRNGNKPKSNSGPKPERRKNDPEAEKLAADLVLDDGMTYEQAAEQAGVGSVQIVKTAVAREEGRREPKVDPAELSMSAREKLEAAIRQYRRKLEREFRERVRQEVINQCNSIWLPDYQKKLDDAKAVLDARRGVMTRGTFVKILSCLHPDSRKSVSDGKLNEAFRAFKRFEVALVKDEEASPPVMELPRTYEEAMALKRKVSEARKAERHARKSGNSVTVSQ